MSLTDATKTVLCAAFTTNVDHMSLHTADPGVTGANDSAIAHKTVTWNGETDGVDTATITYTGLSGDFTHIGLWEGATFRQGIECSIHYTAATTITILLTHTAAEQ